MTTCENCGTKEGVQEFNCSDGITMNICGSCEPKLMKADDEHKAQYKFLFVFSTWRADMNYLKRIAADSVFEAFDHKRVDPQDYLFAIHKI